MCYIVSVQVHFSSFLIGRNVLAWRYAGTPVATCYAVNITMKAENKVRGFLRKIKILLRFCDGAIKHTVSLGTSK